MKIIRLKKEGRYLIRAFRALVGPDLLEKKEFTIVIANGRITSIEKEALKLSVEQPCPVEKAGTFSGADLFKFSADYTLLPALIDAHVHLALAGHRGSPDPAEWANPGRSSDCFQQPLQRFLEAGVGLIRDGGDWLGLNLEVKRLLNNGNFTGPFLSAPGKGLRSRGSYGSFIGPYYEHPAQIEAQAAGAFTAGADHLKVVVSGIVSFARYGQVKGAKITLSDLRAIVALASRYKLPVMAHASSPEAVALALEAGVNSIEHGYFLTADQLVEMAAKCIAWVPTVIPVACRLKEPYNREHGKSELAVIKRTIFRQLEMVNLAARLGVRLGLGTDCGAPGVIPGESLIDELLLYRQAGLTNREALKTATGENAAILGLQNEAGQVEKGFKPYLLVVRGNPLKDLHALKAPVALFLPEL